MTLRVFFAILIMIASSISLPNNAINAQEISCAPYIFLGMSGSGQKSDVNESGLVKELGPEIAALYDQVRKMPEFSGRIIYDPINSYKAVAVPGYSKNLWDDISKFLDGLRSNSTDSLLTRFVDYTKSCPDSRFIIAGYSQGAFAAHYLVTQLERANAEQMKKVFGVILLANPANPKQGIVPFFDVDTRKSKVIKSFSTTWWSTFCTALRATSYYRSCIDVAGEQVANLQIREKLPQPSVMKVFSYNSNLDLVADTARVFSVSNLTREILIARKTKSSLSIVPSKSGLIGEAGLGISNATIKARDIHSSYCSPYGEFAPKVKTKRDRCSDKRNSEFIQGSLNYLREQFLSQ